MKLTLKTLEETIHRELNRQSQTVSTLTINVSVPANDNKLPDLQTLGTDVVYGEMATKYPDKWQAKSCNVGKFPTTADGERFGMSLRFERDSATNSVTWYAP